MPLRRRAVRPAIAGIAAVLAVSLLAACGKSADPSDPSAAGGAGANGTVNWEWALPTSWDPVTSSAGWDVHVLGLVYASLTTLNPAGNVEPGLAKSWTYAKNGKSVTFHLRPNLKFANGTALNATAVQENIHRGQTQSNSTIASELAVISKVVVNSPTSFTLDLTQVDYQIPDLLSGKDGMMVSPAVFTAHPGSLPTQPAGAGPFRLTSYVPDSHANLVRNPGYWDASQIHLANFSVQDITQPEQILSALQSGQVNVAYIAGNQVAGPRPPGSRSP
jgi:peptide/nickel transport system substrate-binding protein